MGASSTQRLLDITGSMYTPSFVCFLLTRACVSLSAALMSVVVGWHLYQATGDPFDLALVGLVQILPTLSLFLITGWVADHYPRKTIMLIGTCVVACAWSMLAWSMQSGTVNRAVLFSIIFFAGCARAFVMPAMQSLLPKLVPSEHLSRAVAVVTLVWNTSTTVGPLMGGVLLAVLDFHAYWVNAGLLIAAFIAITQLPSFAVEATASKPSLSELLGGVKYVCRSPYLAPSIALDMFLVLASSVMALLPVYASDILHVGPEGLGYLRAMPAVGAIATGVVLSKVPEMRHCGRNLFIALVIFSASVLVFGLSTEFWLSLIALFIYGASDLVSVNIRTSVVHLSTPDALRGRVNAVNSLCVNVSNQLGDFRSGSAAALMGAIPSVLVGAAMAFGITAWGFLLSPQLRKLDRVSDISDADNSLTP